MTFSFDFEQNQNSLTIRLIYIVIYLMPQKFCRNRPHPFAATRIFRCILFYNLLVRFTRLSARAGILPQRIRIELNRAVFFDSNISRPGNIPQASYPFISLSTKHSSRLKTMYNSPSKTTHCAPNDVPAHATASRMDIYRIQ